jgi:hypothetical protein
MLFAWRWPSAVYALDIAAWDLCLGVALLLAATTFSATGLSLWVRRGLVLSGVLCLGGLIGVAVGNMQVRNVGIVGYALVLPVVLLLMAKVFTEHGAETTSNSAEQHRLAVAPVHPLTDLARTEVHGRNRSAPASTHLTFKEAK